MFLYKQIANLVFTNVRFAKTVSIIALLVQKILFEIKIKIVTVKMDTLMRGKLFVKNVETVAKYVVPVLTTV